MQIKSTDWIFVYGLIIFFEIVFIQSRDLSSYVLFVKGKTLAKTALRYRLSGNMVEKG